MMSIHEMLDSAKSMGSALLARKGVVPPLFLIHAGREVYAVPAEWGTREEKHAAVLAVKLVCRKVGAERIVAILESWIVERPAGAKTDDLVPSAEPDRREVLFIAAQSNVAGEPAAIAGFFRIERDAAGKPSTGEWIDGDAVHAMTIFDGMLGGGVLQ